MTPYTENNEANKQPKTHKFQILVDSDAFVGQIYPDDAHFEQANGIFQTLASRQARLVTTSLVVAETATVLSHRSGQARPASFLKSSGGAIFR